MNTMNNPEEKSINLPEPFQQMIEHSPCGIVLLNNSLIVYANDRMRSILGVDNKEAIIKKSLDQFIHPSYLKYFTDWFTKINLSHQSEKNIELIFLKNNSHPIHIEMMGNRINYNSHVSVQLFMTDISERKFTETHLQSTTTQPTKKLTDHAFLNEHIKQAIYSAEKNNQHMAVIYLDLDHFNFINETYGYKTADILLEVILQTLKATASANETILTLGCDKFIIIANKIDNVNMLNHIIQKYINLFSNKFLVQNQELTTTATLGVSLFPENGIDSQTLLKNAEFAHAHAKKSGQQKYQIFTSSMTHHIKQQNDLLFDLKQALDKNEFVLLYQPVVDITTGKILRLEALLRWFRSNNEILLPGDFLSLAEETGLIFPIGEWVTKTACKQNIYWQQHGITPVPISINLSMRQFQAGPRLIKNIENTLQLTQLPSHCLEFEINENVSILNISSDILETLHNMGIHLSIDNFGSGFFSLSEIKRYQIKNIKIARSLIANVTKNKDNAEMVAAIIAMSKEMNINVIAEGIETKEQLAFLKTHNCLQAQGNYICAPLSEEELYPIFKTATLQIEQLY